MAYGITQESNLVPRRDTKLSKALTYIKIFLASFLLSTLFTSRTILQSSISLNIHTHDKVYSTLSWHHQQKQPPQQQNHDRQLAVSSPNVDAPLDNFLYMIIHYHKTGHDLSRSLVDIISAGIPNIAKPIVWNRQIMSDKYSNTVKCPTNMNIPARNILIITSPNFFCEPTMLAEILLSERNNSSIFPGNKFAMRGVKIIHLVRNPFNLAVSNYNYHSQDPTPESWVYAVNPCKVEMLQGQTFRDLLLPNLTPIMNEEDFRALHDRCNFLFQNPRRPALKLKGMFAHLRQLKPELGVQLSTLHMLTQAVSGGDITRMVSNIVKFRDLKRIVSHTNALHHIPTDKANSNMIQVMSLSTDDFIVDPHGMALRVLNFCFGNNVSEDIRREIAFKYEQSYVTRQEGGDSHVTHKSYNTEMLKESLRNDKLFGRILGNLETVVEKALEESRV